MHDPQLQFIESLKSSNSSIKLNKISTTPVHQITSSASLQNHHHHRHLSKSSIKLNKMSKADELFPTTSEEEVEEIRPQKKTKRCREESRSSSSMPILDEEGELEKKRTKHEKQSSTRRAEPAVSTVPIRPSLKKPKIRPVTRPTARELFGTDSEDEAQKAACASSSSSSKKPSTLVSSITRRLANGISRQGHPSKEGSHYIDLKVYKVSDIENVSAMNRWRQAVISLKNKTDDNTEAWGYLAKFITASRKEFKDITPTFISNYY